MIQKIFFQILVAVLVLGGASSAQAASEASLYFVPASGVYQETDEFNVELKLNSQDLITSLKAYVTYDPAVLSIESFQVNEATFPFWWEKESEPGLLKLQASIPTPGFQGEQTVATLRLRTEKKSEDAAMSVDPSSLVLRSDDEDVLRITTSSAARFLVGDVSASSKGQELLLIGALAVLIFCAVAIFIMARKKKRINK